MKSFKLGIRAVLGGITFAAATVIIFFVGIGWSVIFQEPMGVWIEGWRELRKHTLQYIVHGELI